MQKHVYIMFIITIIIFLKHFKPYYKHLYFYFMYLCFFMLMGMSILNFPKRYQ